MSERQVTTPETSTELGTYFHELPRPSAKTCPIPIDTVSVEKAAKAALKPKPSEPEETA